MSELLRNMEAAYRYQLGQQQRSPDPRDVAIQELKADQQRMREQMNEMYGYLSEMKGRLGVLIGQLLDTLKLLAPNDARVRAANEAIERMFDPTSVREAQR